MPDLSAVRNLAAECARVECCTSIQLAAATLNCSPETTRAALAYGCEAGYFRQLLAPGFGNKIMYQPTAKAAGIKGNDVPRFIRAGLAQEVRVRGALRGYIRFAAYPDLAYLSAAEQDELCSTHGIPCRGFARALLGSDGENTHIFVPLTPADKPFAAVESASFRWLPLLESGAATLHFVALAGAPADAARAALTALAPAASGADLHAELARIDSEIAADKTGLAALRLWGRKAELIAEIDATPPNFFPWLGAVWEASL